jgi:hypothetical protein
LLSVGRFGFARVRYFGILGLTGWVEKSRRQNSSHRFAHQSARHERSGGLSTAKMHDFSARVFLERCQKANIFSFSISMLQNWWGWGLGGRGWGWGWVGLGWRRVGVGVGLGLGWAIQLFQGSNLLNPCLKYPTPPIPCRGVGGRWKGWG